MAVAEVPAVAFDFAGGRAGGGVEDSFLADVGRDAVARVGVQFELGDLFGRRGLGGQPFAGAVRRSLLHPDCFANVFVGEHEAAVVCAWDSDAIAPRAVAMQPLLGVFERAVRPGAVAHGERVALARAPEDVRRRGVFGQPFGRRAARFERCARRRVDRRVIEAAADPPASLEFERA